MMPRDRWVAISSVLCPYNPKKTHDPFEKIDPLLKPFSHRFTQLYDLGAEVSRDEQCVRSHHRTRNRHIRMKKSYITIGYRIEAITSIKNYLTVF